MREAIIHPVSSPLLVGRDMQLDALAAVMAATQQGTGRIVLISGEAGIGKSRLVAEACARFQSLTGGACVTGHCFETDRSLPFAPFLDLLLDARQLIPSDTLAQLATDPNLAALVPDRRAGPAGARESAPGDKRRTFEALVQCLAVLTQEQPAMVVIEDLHWCDDVSLECIQLLARRIAVQPLLLVLTWRSDEPHDGLQHCLATIDRTRTAVDLPLPRLASAEVERLLRAIFDQPQPIRPDFLRTVVELTDGNPFFVEEVLTSLIAAGDIFRTVAGWARRDLSELQIPRSVRDAVSSRVRRLSPDARRVLDIAAVIGQRVDLAVVQALTGFDDAILVPLLRQLVSARLLADSSADQLSFRHALTRESVYLELLARERQSLHRSVAWTIEELHAEALDTHAAELSYHCEAAGDWSRTFAYAMRALARIELQYSPRAVVEQATRAIIAVQRLAGAVPIDLYHRRGAAHVTLGDFDLARDDFSQALSLSRSSNDRAAECQALLDLGELWLGLDYARAGTYLELAASLAPRTGDSELIARSQLLLGNWHINSERPADAERCLHDALVTFEQVGDRPGQAIATDLLAVVSDIGGDVAGMYARHLRAIALYRELDDRQGLASTMASIVAAAGGSIFEAVPLPPVLAADDALAFGNEALALAREIDWRAGEAYALLNIGLHRSFRGCFDEASSYGRAGLAIAEEIDHHEWMICGYFLLGEVALNQLDIAAARDWLQRSVALARETSAPHFLHISAGWLARCHLVADDCASARQVLDNLPGHLPLDTVGQRLAWLVRGELALAQGDAGTALSIADQLLAAHPVPATPEAIPAVTLLRGEALTALERLTPAEAALRAALDGAASRNIRPLLWRVHRARARLYQSAGRRSAAQQALAEARAQVTALSETIADRTVAATFIERFAQRVEVPPTNGSRQDTTRLTRRERDVAALVARGLSNREIARELFVGERTIETHVGNILGKLGFATRAQIAAWAAASGLVSGIL
jgi:DNA-binding NarL/FixJ family response regulator